MHFSDIFKQSFLKEFAPNYSASSMLLFLGIAAALGLYIFLVYRLVTKKSFYNKSFNLSLWVLTVVTAAIIITISSNIVLSLGMVGALSIVRYRTAIKDPMDLVFLFWAISTGIICGAGITVVAVELAILITIGVFILDKIPMPRPMRIMTVSASDCSCEAEIMAALRQHCKYHKVKSRTLSQGLLNIVVEYNARDERRCTAAISAIKCVTSVSTLAHDGEVTF
ncbi:MAG: DUF4956 domain-containing protein [Prevotellaceae bacterium]|nr:DUF4956 domain-containing protein [Prevotellaceae bacterium]